MLKRRLHITLFEVLFSDPVIVALSSSGTSLELVPVLMLKLLWVLVACVIILMVTRLMCSWHLVLLLFDLVVTAVKMLTFSVLRVWALALSWLWTLVVYDSLPWLVETFVLLLAVLCELLGAQLNMTDVNLQTRSEHQVWYLRVG